MNLIKNSLMVLFTALSVFMISCNNTTETTEEVVEISEGVSGEFKVNAENSELLWTGSKVTGKHFGNINISNGAVVIENGLVTSAKFEVDMTTLTVTDIEDEEMNGQLKGHLFSDDFFSIDSFPTATLYVTGDENNLVSGDLTIKGITNPISFPVSVVENEDGTAVLSGTMTVDRTAYEIKYGSGKFFENLGDKMINDEFTLDFTIKL